MVVVMIAVAHAMASSHREAPLISNDPLADNVDVYAFRSPDNPDMVTLIATYIPFQLPQGAPNYYNFGENIRYEIHVDNDASIPGDEVTYRFTFNIVNEDPTTFFNIRLGQQNQKATYTLERSMDGGMTFTTIVENGVVPPNNIGDRSITGAAGLNTTYDALWGAGITTASTGETVFAGPSDDPFFVDLGGIFDLGDAPRQDGTPVDGTGCYNVSTLAIQVPISTLLKAGAPATPTNILDPDYVIGVWASASRPAMQTISATGDPEYSGDWVQVSRLGMPLTNEAVIPIGQKDFWNAISPYDEISETTMDEYFYNPELALYMDDDQFGGAVPAFGPLRIQTASLGAFDFTNGADGVSGLAAGDLTGTAFEAFGDLLLIPGKPRSVDIWPIFHTGVPNAIPYQLATGKEGNPLAAGKPFIHNFLPNGGDMLRLNMATPVTPRDDPNFSSLGLVQAAAIGLTVAPFNTTADLEFIPNMDGFPNGRRLEDDVTRIELQAVGGIVLAAIGLWYDDYDPMSSPSPVTEDLLNVLTYTTGVESNDRPFGSSFPYVAQPFSATGGCSGEIQEEENPPVEDPDFKLFVSSNTEGTIGIYGFDSDGNSDFNSFMAQGDDGDGIHFDEENDVVYHLNRSENVINAYSNVTENIANGDAPELTATSSSDFTNGREIAVRNGKLVVAQDAADSNGQVNSFVIYDATPTSITLDKVITSPVNLWGLTFIGNDLFAIEDNSSNVAIFENFLDAPTGVINVTRSVTVEGLIRTHGIDYDAESDIMILTDVGLGSEPADGALVVVSDFVAAASDDIITPGEQIRIEGPSTELGNPVDAAYDSDDGSIYVAERANEGGKVLIFSFPTEGGDIAPAVSNLYPGASAVFLSDCVNGNGGQVEEADPVGVVFYDLDACRSFSTDVSNTDFSEFDADYPESLDCADITATNVFRSNPSVNGHSCTEGVNGSIAMCVSAMDNCDYNPDSDKSIIFNVTINPEDDSDGVKVSSLTFFEKGPDMYSWIDGPSGSNNYPTLYGVRISANGSVIFTSADQATTLDWTLEEFDFSDMDDFTFTEMTELTVELLGYCLVGNGAQVSAWDVDNISVNATCAVPSSRAIAGTVKTDAGMSLVDAQVSINALLPEYPRTLDTDENGAFSFDSPINNDYQLTVSKDDNYANGVSTLDLVMIQRHILGLQNLENNYKLLAADMNGDDKVKAADLLILRKLILGVTAEVPNMDSWMFVDANQVLENDDFNFAQDITITALASDRTNEDFIAVKLGDVNGNAVNGLGQASVIETRSSKSVKLSIDNTTANKGDLVSIDFKVSDFDNVSGFQFTMDHTDMKLEDITSDEIEISEANISILDNDRMVVSWTNPNGQTLADDAVLFTASMQATQTNNLEEVIDINSQVINAEMYAGENLEIRSIELSTVRSVDTESNDMLYNNVPNPFNTNTTISFYLAERGTATVNILDVQGKVLKSTTSDYEAGKNFITLRKSDLNVASGVLYYQLKTDNKTMTKKMIIVE